MAFGEDQDGQGAAAAVLCSYVGAGGISITAEKRNFRSITKVKIVPPIEDF